MKNVIVNLESIKNEIRKATGLKRISQVRINEYCAENDIQIIDGEYIKVVEEVKESHVKTTEDKIKDYEVAIENAIIGKTSFTERFESSQNTSKQKDIIIEVPEFKNGKKVKYLSDFTDVLPKNCIFSKGGTGVGGTHLALTSNENYIVCVPFVSLVDNKCAQHKDVLGVKEGVSKGDIQLYLDGLHDKHPAKIMVTYDSLGKIVDLLGDGCKEFNLLIDEMHLLFTQYSFRKEAAQMVLSNYKMFKSYTFMTATQMDSKYTLKELKNELVVSYEWEKSSKVNVTSVQCEDIKNSIANIILMNLESDENMYFFVNSVSFINDICDLTGLSNKDARMICSQNYKGSRSLKISNTSSEPKKVNFITSTAFEGCDLYDENGIIFMVSDGKKSHTLLDISTSVIQIAGRIRNTKYNDQVFHLYTTTRYNGITKEEFQELCLVDIDRSKRLVELYNNTASDLRSQITDSSYTITTEEGMIFDENTILIDMFNFDVHNNYQYYTKIRDEYKSNGIEAVQGIDRMNEIVMNSVKPKLSFKECIIKLEKESDLNLSYEVFKEHCFYRWTWLQEAIEKVGFKKIKALKYRQKDIKDELIKKSNKSDGQKVVRLLKLCGFTNNEFVSNADIKFKLQNAYDSLDMGKAKATDLLNYFDVKPSKKRLNGKLIDGYTIIRSKIQLI